MCVGWLVGASTRRKESHSSSQNGARYPHNNLPCKMTDLIMTIAFVSFHILSCSLSSFWFIPSSVLYFCTLFFFFLLLSFIHSFIFFFLFLFISFFLSISFSFFFLSFFISFFLYFFLSFFLCFFLLFYLFFPHSILFIFLPICLNIYLCPMFFLSLVFYLFGVVLSFLWFLFQFLEHRI
jgi:hypothetical protein